MLETETKALGFEDYTLISMQSNSTIQHNHRPSYSCDSRNASKGQSSRINTYKNKVITPQPPTLANSLQKNTFFSLKKIFPSFFSSFLQFSFLPGNPPL